MTFNLVLLRTGEPSPRRAVTRRDTHDRDKGGDSPNDAQALRDGDLIKIDSEGVIRAYDPETNTFGAYNPDGTTRTFFKPSSGTAYWAKQPGTSPWGP